MLMILIQTMEQQALSDRRELEQLLAAVAQDDREALAQLYDRTRTAVYGLCLSMLKNVHDASDATQETFVRIWEHAPSYRAQGSPMAWILTVARNLARMKLRQAARQTLLDEEEWNALPAPADAVRPEDRLLLQHALSVLSDGERQIILLHAASGLKHREIAALLELPLPTVLSKYHRALKKLKEWMKGDDVL